MTTGFAPPLLLRFPVSPILRFSNGHFPPTPLAVVGHLPHRRPSADIIHDPGLSFHHPRSVIRVSQPARESELQRRLRTVDQHRQDDDCPKFWTSFANRHARVLAHALHWKHVANNSARFAKVPCSVCDADSWADFNDLDARASHGIQNTAPAGTNQEGT